MTYKDQQGNEVLFPMGDISFADEVVSMNLTDRRAAEEDSRPSAALGPPDYQGQNSGPYVTLSCGGTLTLRFTDNSLVDIDGPDLYLFEIGPAVEPTELAISKDGQEWIEVGKVSGGTAAIDISQFVAPGDVFHYVRLTDLKSDCRPRWPGADIDAIGAIGSAMRVSLSGAVLFDSGQSDLKPAALDILSDLVPRFAQYPAGRVVVGGHTDSVGSSEDNQTLSRNRADAVREFLASQESLKAFTFETRAYGETEPIAGNDTEEGRASNRRVDILVIPEP